MAAQVIEPLREEPNPQDGDDPKMYLPTPRSTLGMICTKMK
jgi:hypothetical protein